jgi:hypothetical protein
MTFREKYLRASGVIEAAGRRVRLYQGAGNHML